MWAASLGIESLVLLTALRLLDNATYLPAAQVINYGVLALLIWGSIHFGRKAVRGDPKLAAGMRVRVRTLTLRTYRLAAARLACTRFLIRFAHKKSRRARTLPFPGHPGVKAGRK